MKMAIEVILFTWASNENLELIVRAMIFIAAHGVTEKPQLY